MFVCSRPLSVLYNGNPKWCFQTSAIWPRRPIRPFVGQQLLTLSPVSSKYPPPFPPTPHPLAMCSVGSQKMFTNVSSPLSHTSIKLFVPPPYHPPTILAPSPSASSLSFWTINTFFHKIGKIWCDQPHNFKAFCYDGLTLRFDRTSFSSWKERRKCSEKLIYETICSPAPSAWDNSQIYILTFSLKYDSLHLELCFKVNIVEQSKSINRKV